MWDIDLVKIFRRFFDLCDVNEGEKKTLWLWNTYLEVGTSFSSSDGAAYYRNHPNLLKFYSSSVMGSSTLNSAPGTFYARVERAKSLRILDH